MVYHSRNPQPDVPYRHYPKLIDMARDVDTLILIMPGGPQTRHMINAEVLDALGPRGIVINMSRGTVVDEAALIKALKERKIYSAGLDVFVNEPEVPKRISRDGQHRAVPAPRLGHRSTPGRRWSSSWSTTSWPGRAGKPPLTPVPETPWPPKKRA